MPVTNSRAKKNAKRPPRPGLFCTRLQSRPATFAAVTRSTLSVRGLAWTTFLLQFRCEQFLYAADALVLALLELAPQLLQFRSQATEPRKYTGRG